MQGVRQQRLESDKEMYARRLQLAKAEAQQKAEEASKRYHEYPCPSPPMPSPPMPSPPLPHVLCQYLSPAKSQLTAYYPVAALPQIKLKCLYSLR